MARTRGVATAPTTPMRITRSAAKAMQAAEEERSVCRSRWCLFFVLPFLLVVGAFHAYFALAYFSGPIKAGCLLWYSDFLSQLKEASAKMLVQAKIVFVEVSHILLRLDTESVKDYVAQIRGTYGRGMVNVAALAVLAIFLASLLYLAVKQLKTIKASSKAAARGKKKVRPTKTETGMSSTDSQDDMDEETDEEDEYAGADQEVEVPPHKGPDMIYVSKKLSPEEYDKETQAATQREVVQLLRSPEFRELVQSRGKDEAAFNWQKRRTARQAAQKAVSR